MGLLRFLLALAVIMAHSGAIFGVELIPGYLAVEAFFMISGFYMAMVLYEKYFKIKNYYRLFLSNRFLRIYPLYWLVLILFIAYYLTDGLKTGSFHVLATYASYWNKLNPLSFLYLVISNIIIIGQEYAAFFTITDTGAILYTANALNTKTPLIKFMIDTPIWTVSLELLFYIISPFLIRLKKNMLIVVVLILLAIRLLLKIQGVPFEPYLYRLLPCQILFFLLGILSYHIYTHLNNIQLPRFVYSLVFISIILLTLIYSSFNYIEVKDFVYLAAFFVAIPFTFKLTKKSKADRALGELSYPMYVSHILFLIIGGRVVTHYQLNANYVQVIGALFCISFSAVVVQLFSKKIEAYRAARVKM